MAMNEFFKKGTYYEGGVRVPGFVYSPKYLQNPGRVYKNLNHISDWLPTILHLAGIEFDQNSVDGIDQYEAIFQDNYKLTPR